MDDTERQAVAQSCRAHAHRIDTRQVDGQPLEIPAATASDLAVTLRRAALALGGGA